jgi:hypothetical protein
MSHVALDRNLEHVPVYPVSERIGYPVRTGFCHTQAWLVALNWYSCVDGALLGPGTPEYFRSSEKAIAAQQELAKQFGAHLRSENLP